MQHFFNSLPDDTFLALSKLRALEDDKSFVTQNLKFDFHMVGDIVLKVKKVLLFPQ